MKKSLIALAVFGAFSGAAFADGSVQLYGLIDLGVTHFTGIAQGNVKNAPAEPGLLLRASGASQAFVAPFSVDGQFLGLFYADRQPSARELTQEQFDSFQSFVSLAQVIVRSLPRA